jgi:hypothetical protein
LYASLHFARRLGLDALPEALVCGLFAVLMYSPYDLIGPQMPWWVWKDHLTTETRWLGVPYSSTLWMLLFHAVLCWLVARRDRKQGDESASVPRFSFQVVMVALGTLGLGFITFLPYHGLRFAGLSDATILIAFLVLACSIVALDQPQFRGSKDKDSLQYQFSGTASSSALWLWLARQRRLLLAPAPCCFSVSFYISSVLGLTQAPTNDRASLPSSNR